MKPAGLLQRRTERQRVRDARQRDVGQWRRADEAAGFGFFGSSGPAGFIGSSVFAGGMGCGAGSGWLAGA